MPSIAIEPFSIIYRSISCPAAIVYQIALSSLCISFICPVPSICPATICPPNLPSDFIARSKFTLEPILSEPSAERFIVSCITSALNKFFPSSITVRHTPLVAILSPTLTPSRIVCAFIVSTIESEPLCTAISSPISSIIPVNICFHPNLCLIALSLMLKFAFNQYIIIKQTDLYVFEFDSFLNFTKANASYRRFGLCSAKHLRRNISLYLVYNATFQR